MAAVPVSARVARCRAVNGAPSASSSTTNSAVRRLTCRGFLQFRARPCSGVRQGRATLCVSTVAWLLRLVPSVVLRRRGFVKAAGTVLLVTAVWAVAFAIRTGITALATPWEELAQGAH